MRVTATERGGTALNLRLPYAPERWMFEENRARIKRPLGTKWDATNRTWYIDGPEAVLDFDREGIELVPLSIGAINTIGRFRHHLDAALWARAQESDGMYGYQTIGVDYLYWAERAVLADDMGLGKSKQTVETIRKIWLESGPVPTIVVVLNSLVYNWPDEFDKWFPGAPYAIPPTGKTARKAFWKEFRRAWAEDEDGGPIIITNYEKLGLDDFPDDVLWRIVVGDEATYIKNPSAARSKAFFRAASGAQYVWLLTGTPIEIRYEELYGLFTYIRPAVLGSFSRFRDAHLMTDYVGTVVGARQVGLLTERIAPWILRRKKSDVSLQLPPKLFNDVFIELTPEEARGYRYLNSEFDAWLADQGREVSEVSVLEQLLRLQQYTSSPRLLDSDDVQGSKYAMLRSILAEWDGQALVFSRFAEMADRLVAWLELDTRAIIKGPVNPRERKTRIDDFNAGRLGKVLVSTDAGAHGLNITSADLVIHYDMLWNPAKLRQRENRLHRIGQKNAAVNVVRLLVPHTVDHGMASVADDRQEMADALLDAADEVMIKRVNYRKIARGEYAVATT